jgi:ribosomal protein L44E
VKDNMVKQIKGYCKYCGKEYTKSGMLRHLQACKDRKKELDKENIKRKSRFFA